MPWELLYYEAGMNKRDTYRRERYLKSGNGRKWPNNRLKYYLLGWDGAWNVGGSYEKVNLA